MAPCEHCLKNFSGKCQNCGYNVAELQYWKWRTEDHVHNLYMKIMRGRGKNSPHEHSTESPCSGELNNKGGSIQIGAIPAGLNTFVLAGKKNEAAEVSILKDDSLLRLSESAANLSYDAGAGSIFALAIRDIISPPPAPANTLYNTAQGIFSGLLPCAPPTLQSSFGGRGAGYYTLLHPLFKWVNKKKVN